MKNQIATRSVLLKVKCGVKLMDCPFFVPFKKVSFVSLCTWVIAFFALMSLSSCASMQSESCRGFPFDKDFPGKHHRPYAVRYDLSYKWTTGRDGLYYDFVYRHLKDQRLPSDVYNDKHLPLSTYEKKYIATRQAKDVEFDQKYAGEIKEKLLAVAERNWIPPRNLKYKTWWKANYNAPIGFKAEKGHTVVKYPYYLTGDKLPAGLETPASFFSPDFISRYIVARDHNGSLRDYFISVRWPKNGVFYEFVTGMAEVGYHVKRRFRANFAEYVLTYYFYKDYESAQQRKLVAEDLASYYSDVAFQASAEYLYEYMQILSGRERCDYANYAAQRLFNYIITAFMDPVTFKRVKNEYRDELHYACWLNQLSVESPYIEIPKEEKEKSVVLKNQIYSDTVRCLND